MGDLADEARPPLLEAVHSFAQALAVENRLPEPAAVDQGLLPPLSHCWKEALPIVRAFVVEPTQPWQPVAQSLDQLMQG